MGGLGFGNHRKRDSPGILRDVKPAKAPIKWAPPALLLSAACLLCGCEAPSITRGGFDSGSPAARTHAIEVTIKDARKTGRISRQDLKSMVELLNADDDLVRFMAISALSEVSGDDLGYRFFDPSALRLNAVQKWRAYALESNGTDSIAITPPVETKPGSEISS